MKKDEIREAVRDRYAAIAIGKESNCCGGGSSCGGTNTSTASTDSERLGYDPAELKNLPEGADMGLGCGNPAAIASLKPGETVLDLGSGGGIDCFLAAKRVGEKGRVIGVDMTPDMVGKARRNAEKAGFSNVEFRLGEIEHMPVADNTVDVIISNCVINLSPDKPQVFHEAFRVLKKGGRVAVSDIVATAVLPEDVMKNLALYTGCIAGASPIPDVERMMTNAGFVDISITPKNTSHNFIREWAPGRKIEDYVVSANITGTKP